MTNVITDYLRGVEAHLSAGIATEHTYRPAFQTLVEGLDDKVSVTNEPRRVACGAPDFSISRTGNPEIIGHIETKDIGVFLDQVERTPQLKRYMSALRNLILTDYLEFRWYVDGQLRQTVRLANWNGKKLVKLKEGPANVEILLENFLSHTPQQITSPAELAQRMARLASLIKDGIILAFEQNQASNLLQGWRKAFAEVLIADLDQPEKISEFADMFAQTLAYGLFSARIMDTSPGFSLAEAQRLIPKTNPFLRSFFSVITGPDLDDEPFAGYVADLVTLLGHTDIHAVLADFGKRTRQEDPTVHFYETFLAAYDPHLRKLRGVYYTPQPVVSFIVRAVDEILKTRFGMKAGLADTTTVTFPDKSPGAPKGAKKTQPKVLILDPATGTATFPYAVIDHIRQSFMQQNNAGLWNGFVREQLLPRLFGFELLMASYAVAHFKLALQLAAFDLPESQRKDWAYHFTGDERLNIFLTNTLDQPHTWTGLPLFTQFLANETLQANKVKQDLPIMVILGNPPYSGQSSNNSEWARSLVHDYYFVDGKPLGEKNTKWLQDDYVKFIRWAQQRIERTGSGVLGFITNNGYLDNPTFRGMRQSLMKTFDEIYILDLHGNAKKRETASDGGIDENVFDIQQGVAIGIFVKLPKNSGGTKIYHADIWGQREPKYEQLLSAELPSLPWKLLAPTQPAYLFVPQNVDLRQEYEQGWKITEIFPVNSVGIVTARDALTIQWSPDKVWETVSEFIRLPVEEARERFQLGPDARDWKVIFAQEDLRHSGPDREKIAPILYRPFDVRYTYYTGKSRGFICMPRPEVMRHMLTGENLGIILPRRVEIAGAWQHVFVSKEIIEHVAVSLKTIDLVLPLYVYPDEYQRPKGQRDFFDTLSESGKNERRPNISPQFLTAMQSLLGLRLASDPQNDSLTAICPEDIFHYLYAVLHSPSFRQRYAEFLKMDFPHLPLTSNLDLFRALCQLGAELVALHLLETPKVKDFITRYPVPGDNRVETGFPKYNEPQNRVYINPTQYFEGMPADVWLFQIGGYQVLAKWLKDRRGRQLSFEDLIHYQKIVVALSETIRKMVEIDKAIPGWPIT